MQKSIGEEGHKINIINIILFIVRGYSTVVILIKFVRGASLLALNLPRRLPPSYKLFEEDAKKFPNYIPIFHCRVQIRVSKFLWAIRWVQFVIPLPNFFLDRHLFDTYEFSN